MKSLSNKATASAAVKRRLVASGGRLAQEFGFNRVAGEALAEKISVSDRQFVRVTSIGENNGVESGVWAVFEVGENKVTPIYWREEQMQ